MTNLDDKLKDNVVNLVNVVVFRNHRCPALYNGYLCFMTGEICGYIEKEDCQIFWTMRANAIAHSQEEHTYEHMEGAD